METLRVAIGLVVTVGVVYGLFSGRIPDKVSTVAMLCIAWIAFLGIDLRQRPMLVVSIVLPCFVSLAYGNWRVLTEARGRAVSGPRSPAAERQVQTAKIFFFTCFASLTIGLSLGVCLTGVYLAPHHRAMGVVLLSAGVIATIYLVRNIIKGSEWVKPE